MYKGQHGFLRLNLPLNCVILVAGRQPRGLVCLVSDKFIAQKTLRPGTRSKCVMGRLAARRFAVASQGQERRQRALGARTGRVDLYTLMVFCSL